MGCFGVWDERSDLRWKLRRYQKLCRKGHKNEHQLNEWKVFLCVFGGVKRVW